MQKNKLKEKSTAYYSTIFILQTNYVIWSKGYNF